MIRLEHAIEIEAPRELVWATTIDVENWPRWTPTTTRVRPRTDGPFGVGFAAIVEQPGLGAREWRVTQCETGRSFAWETRGFGMRMVARHAIADSSKGCVNTLSIEIGGWVAWLLRPLIVGRARQALDQENRGLKKFCENAAAKG